MNLTNIKEKKEEVCNLARKSVLFSTSADNLTAFIKAVGDIEEGEQAEEYLEELINKFKEEKEEVLKSYNNLFN